MKYSRVEQSTGTSIDHNLGYFLDPQKYVPITEFVDESAALIKLNLIHENFLSIVIENLRREGTEKFVDVDKYFMPKIKTAVALGLPVSLAKCLTEMNNIRNKYAHKIEYIITDEDAERIDSLIMSVPVDDINHASLIDSTLITSITNLGASSIAFMNDIPKDFPDNRRRICKLVAMAFCISNLGAFWLLNELHRQGKLKMGSTKMVFKPS
ncbi:hypothetical protein D3P58_24600 [Salmonella enterica]|nr:hypothetical protein [Salmonella enterica]ECK6166497.1 hypothetical protein [Salmonella enterica]